jgi:hypothetical protein
MFYEIPVNQKFSVDGVQYQKVQEERISCCKIKRNAVKLDDNTGAVIGAKQAIEIINEETPPNE